MNKATQLYRDARPQIESGDVLLFRAGTSIISRLITSAGRSDYCHAGMAGWWGNRLMALEMCGRVGGRAVLLSNLVRKYSGSIDVYSPKGSKPLDRRAALGMMLTLTGSVYGWWSLLRASLLHLFIVRFFVRADTGDGSNGSPPYCSQAVARAYRAGGIDPVPRLADYLTEPGDLARSSVLTYLFTLA